MYVCVETVPGSKLNTGHVNFSRFDHPHPFAHTSHPSFSIRLTARRDAKGLELNELTSRRSAVEVEIQEAQAAVRAAGTESAKLTEQLEEVLKQVRLFVQYSLDLAFAACTV